MIRLTTPLAIAGLFVLSACAVGPDYVRPTMQIPAAFKEFPGWKESEPRDAQSRGDWWAIYNDPALDRLEKQIDISNQNLKAVEAAYRQSQAIVDQARSSFFPSIGLGASQTRSQSGAGSTGSTLPSSRGAISRYGASISGSWEPDIWGKVRRSVESEVAGAQATAAVLASARLSAQTSLAIDYFQLRAQDELKRLLDAAVVAYGQSLQIAQNRYNAGVAAKADVVTAQTQLLTARAQSINADILRAQLEHAIAVLIGQPPTSFALEPAPLATDVPTVPAGLPSTLLERRPDIADAERRVAAANAQIGVAISGFFPNLNLSGSYGYTSSTIGSLFALSSRVWSVGPSLAETLFDAGAHSAQVAQARAAYDQNVADYRQSVLTAFQQVEDFLAGLRILSQQSVVERDLVASAQEAELLTLNQYKAGTVPYSSVITAQTTALNSRESALSVLENRLIESVSLISALGGGWDASRLPTADQVEDNSNIPFLPF